MSSGEGERQVLAAVFGPQGGAPSLRFGVLESLRPDEIRVRIVATGLCHTDLAVWGRMTQPTVLGHEGAGVVEAIGAEVTKVEPGDAVVLTFDSCGACDVCRVGSSCYCRSFAGLNMTGRRLDGTTALTCEGEPVGAHFFGQSSLATHAVVHARNVVKAPADAPLERLGPLGCGVQTGAGAVLNVLRPGPDASLLVVGAGAVGLSAVMAARVADCGAIAVVEPHPQRRELALDLGATHAFEPGEGLPPLLRQAFPDGLQGLIDTTGRGGLIAELLEVMAPGGVVVALAAHPADPALSLPLGVAIGKGLTIRGVVEGESEPDEFIPRLIDLHAQGRFPFDRLVSFYDLADLDQALADHKTGVAIKPVLRMPAI